MSARSPEDENTSLEEDFAEQVRAARRNRDLITALTRWRTEHGPNQREVAKRMHTSQPAVTRLESHQHDAQLSTLARYVAALGLTMDFVLTDSKTGARVWTSIEDLSTKSVMDDTTTKLGDTPSSSVPSGEGLNVPGLLVIKGAWKKLSNDLLKPDMCLMTASNEPGWNVLYEISPGQPVSSDSVTPRGGRLEEAEDPKVLGVFGPGGSDPVAIATVAGSNINELRQVHRLVAKVRDEQSGAPGVRTEDPHKVRVFDLPMVQSVVSVGQSVGASRALIFGWSPEGLLSENLALPIEDLNLSVRTFTCLKREGIQTVGELITHNHDDLLNIRNFGLKSVEEVENKLMDMGLALMDSPWSKPGRYASGAAAPDDDV